METIRTGEEEVRALSSTQRGVFSLSPCLRLSLSPLLLLAASGIALAQAPLGTPSAVDQNRVPIYGGPNQPSVLRQAPIGSFPRQPVVPPVSQFRPPRPGLSPFLNLYRGAGGIGGVGAVDYFNFVRPAQQALGSFSGRQMGPYSPSGRFGDITIDSHPQLPPESVTHSAGAASTFMNTGPFFNSMGTIGSGQVPQQQRPPIRIGAR